MSKYIRTKDRIGERLKPSKDYPEVEDEHWLGIVNGLIHKDNEPIIAEANTIEELCDEFVLEDETLPPHLKRDLKELCRYKIYIAGSRGVIYGAIWTDKGLIYVAKMNDKGELELI